MQCYYYRIYRWFDVLSSDTCQLVGKNAPTGSGDLIRKAFLTKADDWAYEKERRIFEMDRAGQYMFYAPRSLVGVILGAKISNIDEAKVRDLLIEREARGHPSLRLYRAVCQESSYAVKVYQD